MYNKNGKGRIFHTKPPLLQLERRGMLKESGIIKGSREEITITKSVLIVGPINTGTDV